VSSPLNICHGLSDLQRTYVSGIPLLREDMKVEKLHAHVSIVVLQPLQIRSARECALLGTIQLLI
jgi:hypothetical protein